MNHRASARQAVARGGFYLLGMLLLAVGLTLNTKATLGVSAIISVAFCVSELTGVRIGNTTLVWYLILIAAQIALHLARKTPGRRRAVLFDILQLPVSLIFTRCMNFVSAALPVFEVDYAGRFPGSVWGRICIVAIAVTLTGIGAALTLNMRLIPNPGDGIVQSLADFFHKPVGTAKNLTDLCCVALTAAVSLLAARRIIGIGIGTVIAALGTGRVIALFNRLFAARLRALAFGTEPT